MLLNLVTTDRELSANLYQIRSPYGFSNATVPAGYIPVMPIVLRPTHADSAPTGGKILLVDDDEDLLEALSFLLRRAGFSPLTATSLPAAIRLFACERPEIGVLDVDLGRWSGLDLLQQLRERSNIPILMLTGSVSEHLKARSMALGADDCLAKPISAGQLIVRIRAAPALTRRIPPSSRSRRRQGLSATPLE